jgi:hypothetical protein
VVRLNAFFDTRCSFSLTTVASQISRSAASQRLLAALIVAIAVTLASIFAVLGKTPYDDEIANFRLVEGRDIGSVVRLANSTDVHPPGSYVINSLLYDVLGSWERVKIASGCLNALALALFAWLAYGTLQGRQRFWLIFLLATASTTVLWGASVRWYAYFNPIFTATLAILLFSDISRTARTVVLGAAVVLLFYVGYAAFCAALVLGVAHLGRDLQEWKLRDFLVLALCGVLALAVCAPQLLVFLRVHAPNQANQVGSPAKAFLQTALTLVLGNTVFPIAPLPLCYLLVVLLAVGFWLCTQRKSQLEWVVLGALSMGIACMILTGIGIKPRNSVYLLPLALLVVCSAIATLPRLPYLIASIALIAFQGVGILNVIAHENTIKGSYNTDFAQVMRQLRLWQSQCGAIVVLNHDPVLSYLLDQARITQSSPYERAIKPTVRLAQGECAAVIKTYRGVIPEMAIAAMYAVTDDNALRLVESRDVDPDRYFAIKGRLAHDSLPPVYVHLDLYRASRDMLLPDWSAFATAEGASRTRGK